MSAGNHLAACPVHDGGTCACGTEDRPSRLRTEIDAVRELRDALDDALEHGFAPSRLERARKAYEAMPVGQVLRREASPMPGAAARPPRDMTYDEHAALCVLWKTCAWAVSDRGVAALDRPTAALVSIAAVLSDESFVEWAASWVPNGNAARFADAMREELRKRKSTFTALDLDSSRMATANAGLQRHLDGTRRAPSSADSSCEAELADAIEAFQIAERDRDRWQRRATEAEVELAKLREASPFTRVADRNASKEKP